MRESVRTGAWFASLLVLGLAAGLGWQRMQADQRGPAVGIPWLTGAVDAVRRVVARDATAPILPPFALRGTTVSTEPARSTAIFDLGKGKVYLLHPGSTLPGVGRLLEVTSEGVYFEIGGSRKLITVRDSTLGLEELSTPVQYAAQGVDPPENSGEIPAGQALGRSNGAFVVPADAPRLSDAPRDEPELNATPRPGQSIDTTVWN